jgi:2-polyprenyl-3-methyl-5-hydroxy-6-metoxy-1,4-benzoquinol methylase
MELKLTEIAAEFLGITEEEVVNRINSTQARGIEDWNNKSSIIDFYKETEHYIYDLIKFNSQERLTSLMYPIQRINNYTILDFGGGIGILSIFLSANNTVYYYDLDGKTKKFAKFLNEKIGGKVIFLDSLEEVYDKTYDMIISMDVLEHLENPLDVAFKLHDCVNKEHGLFYTTGMRFSINETLPMHIKKNMEFQVPFEKFMMERYHCVFYHETGFETLFIYVIKK